eukprot:TRINITY_DN6508_c0_g1_i1.p1 TRINITY_DN6508_c0_g1~~TRINITY_DN6508_c0_g1_i1.p1  ORF type:complete len:665 (-),score=121.07 TRINITY_DN6508_c0_g1_i1:608-2542(-)
MATAPQARVDQLGVHSAWQEEQERIAAMRITFDKLDGWWVDGCGEVQGLLRVAGVDISPFPEANHAVATVVVLSFPDMEVLYERSVTVQTSVPYVPTYLAFREAPPLAMLLSELPVRLKPQVVFVDGNGAFHPRRCGVATHVGIAVDLPTIGVAKRLLDVHDVRRSVANRIEKQLRRAGDWAPLTDRDLDVDYDHDRDIDSDPNLLAVLLRPTSSRSTLVVSPGHRVCLSTAAVATAAACWHTVVEPVRQADLRSRAAVRAWLDGAPLPALTVGEARKERSRGCPLLPVVDKLIEKRVRTKSCHVERWTKKVRPNDKFGASRLEDELAEKDERTVEADKEAEEDQNMHSNGSQLEGQGVLKTSIEKPISRDLFLRMRSHLKSESGMDMATDSSFRTLHLMNRQEEFGHRGRVAAPRLSTESVAPAPFTAVGTGMHPYNFCDAAANDKLAAAHWAYILQLHAGVSTMGVHGYPVPVSLPVGGDTPSGRRGPADGRKLNPAAPEFVPEALSATAFQRSPSSLTPTIAAESPPPQPQEKEEKEKEEDKEKHEHEHKHELEHKLGREQEHQHVQDTVETGDAGGAVGVLAHDGDASGGLLVEQALVVDRDIEPNLLDDVEEEPGRNRWMALCVASLFSRLTFCSCREN